MSIATNSTDSAVSVNHATMIPLITCLPLHRVSGETTAARVSQAGWTEAGYRHLHLNNLDSVLRVISGASPTRIRASDDPRSSRLVTTAWRLPQRSGDEHVPRKSLAVGSGVVVQVV